MAHDPARCLRSAASVLRSRRMMEAQFPRIADPEYQENARRSIAMSAEDARRFLRLAILSGRERGAARAR